MELPQEVILWRVMPALRKELVVGLKKHSISQKTIAAKLNITPAAVSQYMSNKRAAKSLNFNSTIKDAIANSVIIIKESKEKNIGIKELLRLVELTKKEHIICRYCILGNPGCHICGK